ncbi:MAG: hypothetical protein GX557_14135 [Chloroflexi bacterium]|nr:hypothetical protein [Chloroflexota bacterium]
MLRRLLHFVNDESGGIVEAIVTVGVLVIIVGGVWYAMNGGLAEVGSAVERWLCDLIPGACS